MDLLTNFWLSSIYYAKYVFHLCIIIFFCLKSKKIKTPALKVGANEVVVAHEGHFRHFTPHDELLAINPKQGKIL